MPTQNHTHQHHYEPHYNFDLVGCCSAVVVALFSFVIINHGHSTLTSKGHHSARLLFVSLQKDGDKVTPAFMLRDVMREMFTPPTANSRLYQKTFVLRFACTYSLFSKNELYLLPCFLALLIIDGHLDCPLGLR